MAAIDVTPPQPQTQTLKTIIGICLDRSGSMGVKRADVIHGFNVYLKDQQALPDPCRCIMTQFNTEFAVTQPLQTIQAVRPLSDETYVPGGNTALLDAFAHTVSQIEKEKASDERVIMLIITDGEENSSKETTYEQVKAMIKAKEAQGDWTFTYLGVSLDQWAQKYGGQINNAQQYNVNKPGSSFKSASHATSDMRNSSERSSKNFYGKDAGDDLNKVV